MCEREIPNDVLVAKNSSSIDDLPLGASVATGSLRRKSQLLNYRPDLNVTEIRGNVPTRLRKFDESPAEGMLLAYAGLHRLGLDDRIASIVPARIMLPAVGQGAVAIEVRTDDSDMLRRLRALDHPETRICVTAERAFLERLEGGCQVPIGAFARIEDDRLILEGVVGSTDGKTVFRRKLEASVSEAEKLGLTLAEELIDKGAARLLTDARADAATARDAVL